MSQILRAVAPLLLLWSDPGECNTEDKIIPWQQEIWDKNPEVIWFSIRNDSPDGDNPGIYAWVGNALTSVSDEGTGTFVKPFEFFWSNSDYTDPAVKQVRRYGCNSWCPGIYGFKIVSIGANRWNFRYVNSALLGSVTLIRQLEVINQDGSNATRWVGVIKVAGQTVVLKYTWSKVSYVFGVPTGVDYINLHGYAVKDCKIDYSKDIVKRITNGKNWELKSGDDPLCACPPNPTCAEEAITISGVDSCRMVKQIIPSIMRESVYTRYATNLRELAEYVDHKDRPGGDEYRKIADSYLEETATKLSCDMLPPKVPGSLKESLQGCVETLLYSMSVSEFVFFAKEGGGMFSSSAKSQLQNMDSVDQIKAILESPLQRYLQCIKTESAVALLEFGSKKSGVSLDIIQGQIQSALASSYVQQESGEAESLGPGIEIQVLLFTNILLLCIMCCSYCKRCPGAGMLAAIKKAPEGGRSSMNTVASVSFEQERGEVHSNQHTFQQYNEHGNTEIELRTAGGDESFQVQGQAARGEEYNFEDVGTQKASKMAAVKGGLANFRKLVAAPSDDTPVQASILAKRHSEFQRPSPEEAGDQSGFGDFPGPASEYSGSSTPMLAAVDPIHPSHGSSLQPPGQPGQEAHNMQRQHPSSDDMRQQSSMQQQQQLQQRPGPDNGYNNAMPRSNQHLQPPSWGTQPTEQQRSRVLSSHHQGGAITHTTTTASPAGHITQIATAGWPGQAPQQSGWQGQAMSAQPSWQGQPMAAQPSWQGQPLSPRPM